LERKILVGGGGIGGLSTAIALRNKGFHVDVVEIRPDLHSSVYGVGIIQPVNALRALDAIGCAEACMRYGYSTTAWGRLLDVNGNQIREIQGATIPGSNLPPMNGITRPKLHEILTNRAIEVGARISYNTTIKDVTDKSGGVAVAFSNGTTATYDIVVGADGVYSEVRKYVCNDDVKPGYNGQSAFRCNIPRKIPGEMEIDRIILQRSEQGMCGFVPIGPDLAYVFYNSTWDLNDRPPPNELDKVMRQRMAHYGGLAGRVRDDYINDPAKVVLRPEEWLIAPPPWHKGRIVMIGDAVHGVTPHLGQGAALAMEDGIVLADCLARYNDLEEAFSRYTDRRYERCKLVVESSVQIGKWQMEKSPTAAADQAALTQRVIETMIQPI
jgi:2-polyprenyl-6-methoxyphenol hydroxylase-like FAD-dependent oxidoreductase